MHESSLICIRYGKSQLETFLRRENLHSVKDVLGIIFQRKTVLLISMRKKNLSFTVLTVSWPDQRFFLY